MPRDYQFVVGADEVKTRLDRYLVSHLPQTLSRTAIQRAIDDGAVTVDGRPAKASRPLKAQQTVVARFDQLGAKARQHEQLLPEAIPLEIVYEDAHVLVINKPVGLVTHPAPGHWTGTLVNGILWHLQQAQGARSKGQGNLEPRTLNLEPELPRAGIVHRLDKDTSGLLVVAKTDTALRLLARQLKARTISRHYVACVEGHLPYDEGRVEAAIGRHPTHRKEMAIRLLGGRQAVTHYHVLKRVGTRDPRPETRDASPFPYTIVDVKLETGRTHQIRVHFRHLRHPVVGDTVYGNHAEPFWTARGVTHQLLHAYAIRFLHPATGAPVELVAEVPADMRPWLAGCVLQPQW